MVGNQNLTFFGCLQSLLNFGHIPIHSSVEHLIVYDVYRFSDITDVNSSFDCNPGRIADARQLDNGRIYWQINRPLDATFILRNMCHWVIWPETKMYILIHPDLLI